MPEFRYISPDEMAQRHRTRNATTPSRQDTDRPTQRQPMQRNVEAVLSLGDVRYITFHNRVYRIPPVPFTQGQRALDSHIKVLGFAQKTAMTGDAKASREFYREMHRLADILWRHIRPIGKFRRVLWRLRLLKNPFYQASEGEMKAITDFFLQGRMTSSVRSISETEALG